MLLEEGVCYDHCIAMQPWCQSNKTTVLMHPGSVAQSCATLCDPVDCSSPSSSTHGIFQARILEWLPFPSPGDLPNSLTEPSFLVSPTLAGGFFYHCATWEAQLFYYSLNFTFGSLMCIWAGFRQVPKDTIKFFLQKDFRIIISQAALVSQKAL